MGKSKKGKKAGGDKSGRGSDSEGEGPSTNPLTPKDALFTFDQALQRPEDKEETPSSKSKSPQRDKKTEKKKALKSKSKTKTEKSLKGKKKKSKEKGKRSKSPDQSKTSKTRFKSSLKSAEDDDVFQWLMDMESLKDLRIESYAPADLLPRLPQHQWLLVPSIKWTLLREAKERERLLKLELEAVALAAAAAAAEEEEEKEGEREDVELLTLFPPLSPHFTCNPCPCKDNAHPLLLTKETEAEELKHKERRESELRWFAMVVVSAHKRRPHWIPPPEDYLRMQHQIIKDHAHAEEGQTGGGGDQPISTPDPIPAKEKVKDESKKERAENDNRKEIGGRKSQQQKKTTKKVRNLK